MSTISLRDASRRYAIPLETLHDYIQSGQVRVMLRSGQASHTRTVYLAQEDVEALSEKTPRRRQRAEPAPKPAAPDGHVQLPLRLWD